MHILALSLLLVTSSNLELEEDPIEVRIPKLDEKDDVAVQEALAVIQKPASNAGLHEAAKVCALLGIDVMKAIAAAKAGAADTLDERLLAVADVYLGFGDWASAEKALLATHKSPGVSERMGHALRAQSRFSEAAKAYVDAIDAASGSELADIVQRVAPIMNDWVSDFEITRSATMRDGAKAVLTAMLPHQAGESSEDSKQRLARLAAPGGKPPALTAVRLRDAVAVQVPALRGCYARALVHDSTLKGKVVVKLSVDEAGKVVSVQTASNGTGSKRLVGCIEPRFKALHLATTTAAEVTYPLAFEPL